MVFPYFRVMPSWSSVFLVSASFYKTPRANLSRLVWRLEVCMNIRVASSTFQWFVLSIFCWPPLLFVQDGIKGKHVCKHCWCMLEWVSNTSPECTNILVSDALTILYSCSDLVSPATYSRPARHVFVLSSELSAERRVDEPPVRLDHGDHEYPKNQQNTGGWRRVRQCVSVLKTWWD